MRAMMLIAALTACDRRAPPRAAADCLTPDCDIAELTVCSPKTRLIPRTHADGTVSMTTVVVTECISLGEYKRTGAK